MAFTAFVASWQVQKANEQSKYWCLLIAPWRNSALKARAANDKKITRNFGRNTKPHDAGAVSLLRSRRTRTAASTNQKLSNSNSNSCCLLSMSHVAFSHSYASKTHLPIRSTRRIEEKGVCLRNGTKPKLHTNILIVLCNM